MSRAVVSVATGPYLRGQDRLITRLKDQGQRFGHHRAALPNGCPPHSEVPYAFKAFALRDAAAEGSTTLLWCDSCILPIRSFEPAWSKIERDGYLIMRNGFTNYEWTADSAYPALFPEIYAQLCQGHTQTALDAAQQRNRSVPHVVAGFFGLDLRQEVGRAIMAEYYRLASETAAFCGPHTGPVGVRHRHDQTALSVIAWRLGCVLSNPPEFFSYPPAGWNRQQPLEGTDQRTCAIADGGY